MLSGLAAVAVDSLFSFAIERIEHSVYMFLMGGIILGLYLGETPATTKHSAPKNALVIILLIVAAFNLFLGKKKFDFEKYLKLAIFYNEQKRFSETITAVNHGRNTFFTVDITGNPIELYSAVAHKELRNYDASIKDFTIARSYSPYNCRTYNNRATLHWDLKQLQNSIDDYKTALLYAPEFETVLKNLAITYYHAGQYAASIETIAKLKVKDELVMNVLNDAKKKLGQTP
jgi:tetratricopeptide (TPR) repeat protein